MSFFTRNDFVHNISEYCKRCGWKLAQIQANGASLIFTMPSGREQYLYLVPYQSTIEFSVPSVAAFASLSEVPHGLSTTLLERNAQQRIGFWCIEDMILSGIHKQAGARRAKCERRVFFGRAIGRNQSARRAQLRATAAAICWRWVLARPM